jgi:FMN phosphatase YigB (HAD superfamily)
VIACRPIVFGRSVTPITGAKTTTTIHEARRATAIMMPGPIAGSVEILAELKALGASLYCLTNFSAETYPPTFERFEFLRWFRGVVVSGEVGVVKPDPRIFELLRNRYRAEVGPSIVMVRTSKSAAPLVKSLNVTLPSQ